MAGTVAKIRGVVKNIGTAPAYRVRAVLESDNPIFDENEMVFGRIGPGESKSYELSVKVPASSFTRTDELKATVQLAARRSKASGADLLVNIEGKARPMFAYTYQTIDDQKGSNHDGQVQRGEQVPPAGHGQEHRAGTGHPHRGRAPQRHGPGGHPDQRGPLRRQGSRRRARPRRSRSSTRSGPSSRATSTSSSSPWATRSSASRSPTRSRSRSRPPGPAPETGSGTATIAREGAPLRETASEAALVVGRAPKGTTFKVSGKLGAFTRLDLDNNRSAFVATTDVASGGAVHGTLVPAWQVTPPVLTVTAPTVAMGDTVHIKGNVSDDRLVRDVYVRVWNRNAKIPVKKVFYQPNRTSGDRTKMDFETDIPLWPGSNLVQVFARESNEVQSLQTVVVLKRAGASVVAQPSSPLEGRGSRPTRRCRRRSSFGSSRIERGC